MRFETCSCTGPCAGNGAPGIEPPAPPTRAWLHWLLAALAACLFSGVIVAGGTASNGGQPQPCCCFGAFDD